MVARTKMSPLLLVDEPDRQNRNEGSKAPSHLQQNHSFSDSSALSHCESLDGSLSSSPPRAVAPAPSAERVRSRFLNRLGISPPKSLASCSTGALQKPRSVSRDLSQDESFQVSLKDNDGEKAKSSLSFGIFLRSSSLSTSSSSESSERSVSFAPSVTVHPIPKHSAYSSRIRETIWTNPTDMQESAARNCIEFASENWDWRQVAEDKDMIYYQGELVHPVHFHRQYNIRQQFCAVMSAQQGHSLR